MGIPLRMYSLRTHCDLSHGEGAREYRKTPQLMQWKLFLEVKADIILVKISGTTAVIESRARHCFMPSVFPPEKMATSRRAAIYIVPSLISTTAGKLRRRFPTHVM